MLEVAEVAGANSEDLDGNFKVGEDVGGDPLELFKVVHGFFGLTDSDHFYLVELMCSEEAFFVNAVAADFFSEAHGVGGLEDGEVFLVDELV